MKKIILLLLIPFISLGQVKVRDLPTTTGGVGGDWLIKNDQTASPAGTKKISVDNFITTYSLQTAPTTTCTTQSLNDSTTKLSNTIFVDRAVSLRVPYTGATSDLDMGLYNVNAHAMHIKGTGTAGHLGLRRQTGTPSASANESSLFANTNGDIGWQNDSNYLTTFKTSLNTSDRIYAFQNKSYTVGDSADIALKANIASPTFTGTLTAPVITATAISTTSLTLGGTTYTTMPTTTMPTTTLTAGSNISLTSGTNTYTVATSLTPTFTSVSTNTLVVTTLNTTLPYELCMAITDEATAITATDTNSFTMSLPTSFTATSVWLSVGTAQSSGSTLTIDMKKNNTSIFSTKLSVDNAEFNSGTAATPAVLSTTAFAAGDRFSVYRFQVGTGAKGAKVCIKGYRSW